MAAADENFYKLFSRKMREIRAERGVTQSQLARETDINHSYLSRIEHGGRLPSRAMVLRIAQGLGLVEGDQQYNDLLEAAGYTGSYSNTSPRVVKSSQVSCMELYLINQMFPKLDEKSQVEVRLSLRLLMEGMDARLRRIPKK